MYFPGGNKTCCYFLLPPPPPSPCKLHLQCMYGVLCTYWGWGVHQRPASCCTFFGGASGEGEKKKKRLNDEGCCSLAACCWLPVPDSRSHESSSFGPGYHSGPNFNWRDFGQQRPAGRPTRELRASVPGMDISTIDASCTSIVLLYISSLHIIQKTPHILERGKGGGGPKGDGWISMEEDIRSENFGCPQDRLLVFSSCIRATPRYLRISKRAKHQRS